MLKCLCELFRENESAFFCVKIKKTYEKYSRMQLGGKVLTRTAATLHSCEQMQYYSYFMNDAK